MKKKNTSVMTISVDSDIRKSLDLIALEIDITISKLARNLIYSSLEDYKLLNTMGIGKQIYAFRSSCNIIEHQSIATNNCTDLDQEVNIGVVIDNNIKEVMNDYSKQLGIPLKTFARNLIYIGLNDLKLLKKVGILRFTLAFEAFIGTYFKKDS